MRKIGGKRSQSLLLSSYQQTTQHPLQDFDFLFILQLTGKILCDRCIDRKSLGIVRSQS